MKRMMIDIETLSLRPEAAVTQIGLCLYDFSTGKYLVEPFNWNLDVRAQPGRDIDFETLQWWMRQSDAARDAVFSPAVRMSPQESFEGMVGVMRLHQPDEVWASPAMFDLPILTSLWGGRKPWVYNQERCMMTLYKVRDPNGALRPPPAGTAHKASDDAAWQMQYLINLLAA